MSDFKDLKIQIHKIVENDLPHIEKRVHCIEKKLFRIEGMLWALGPAIIAILVKLYL